VRQLIGNHKTDLDATDNLGRTPLHYAVLHGYKSAIQSLLQHHVNTTPRDILGKTPLQYASQ
ncbi:ankyrin repeat-containing domain protein, partial [Baffinella frigidus]